MKRVLFSILMLVLVVSLCGCRTGVVYSNEINDGFKEEYKLVLPFDNMRSTIFGNRLNFSTEPALSFADMRTQLEEKGYYVETNSNYMTEHLLVGFSVNGSYILCFIIKGPILEKSDNKLYFFAGPLIEWAEGYTFPFPSYLVKTVESFPSQDENIFAQYGLYAETDSSYDDIIEFYNHSLAEIVETDNENRSIVIEAVEKKKGNSDNSFVRITYFEHEGKNYIGVKGFQQGI